MSPPGSALKRRKLDIAIIEPSEKHYYQPHWTPVGGGVTKKEATEKREADLIPTVFPREIRATRNKETHFNRMLSLQKSVNFVGAFRIST